MGVQSQAGSSPLPGLPLGALPPIQLLRLEETHADSAYVKHD